MIWYMCVCAKLLQLCPTLFDPMDCSPPGSSLHGILQETILEWVAMPSSKGTSQSRDRTCVSRSSCVTGATREPLSYQGSPRIPEWVVIPFSRESSWPRYWIWVSHIVDRFFTIWATREIHQCRRLGFNPCVRKIPWRRKWQPPPVFLPGKIYGQKSLVGYSPWDHKESDKT